MDLPSLIFVDSESGRVETARWTSSMAPVYAMFNRASYQDGRAMTNQDLGPPLSSRGVCEGCWIGSLVLCWMGAEGEFAGIPSSVGRNTYGFGDPIPS